MLKASKQRSVQMKHKMCPLCETQGCFMIVDGVVISTTPERCSCSCHEIFKESELSSHQAKKSISQEFSTHGEKRQSLLLRSQVEKETKGFEFAK